MSKPDVSKIFGKIKIVDHFPDYKVKIVNHLADLDVRIVSMLPSTKGQWEIVDHFPDFTITCNGSLEGK